MFFLILKKFKSNFEFKIKSIYKNPLNSKNIFCPLFIIPEIIKNGKFVFFVPKKSKPQVKKKSRIKPLPNNPKNIKKDHKVTFCILQHFLPFSQKVTI